MIAEMWGSFPRLLVNNIDALLDEADPNPIKAFHLYKTCQHEGVWTGEFAEFAKRLDAFYSKPRHLRSKGLFDSYLDRPMHRSTYAEFHLTFRNCVVHPRALDNLSSWLHHMMRVGAKTSSLVASIDVMRRTLGTIANPGPLDKDENIGLDDFCEAWKKTVFKLFGRKYEPELESLIGEIRWLQTQLEEAEVAAREKKLVPSIYLTQTEIDWTLDVREAALQYEMTPNFPLTRGPQKQRLQELERAGQLYNIVQQTKLPELLRHREKIRATILALCDGLIRDKAA